MRNLKNKTNTKNLNNINNIDNGKYLNNADKHKLINILESIGANLNKNDSYNGLVYDYINDMQQLEDNLKAYSENKEQLSLYCYFELLRHKDSMLNLLTDMLEDSKNNQCKINQILSILYK